MAKKITVSYGRRVQDSETGNWDSQYRDKVYDLAEAKDAEKVVNDIVTWCSSSIRGWVIGQEGSNDAFLERFFAE